MMEAGRGSAEVGGEGILLCLGAEEGAEVGIDTQIWTIGPRFKGVGGLRLGPHFVSYSPKAAHPSAPPPRRARFFTLNARDPVRVVQWNAEVQDLQGEPEIEPDMVTAMVAAAKNGEFATFLGVAETQTDKRWRGLSDHISDKVLDRLLPVGGSIWSEAALQERQFPAEDKGTPLSHASYFTQIPRRPALPPGASAQEITKLNMDKSALLERLLAAAYEDDYRLLIGELQYCFICFVLGQVLAAFEQWKAFIVLLCSCEDALLSKASLYTSFLSVLHHQLRHAPNDLFTDEMLGNNFLQSCLQDFFELASDERIDPEIVRRATRLQRFLQKRFGWQFCGYEEQDV